MVRIFIFQLIFVVISNSSYSADLRGRIKDIDTGEEVIGSQVYIKELKKGAISGLDGSYVIKNIPGGTYNITCSFIGYQTIEKEIIIKDNTIGIIDFGLTQQTRELTQVTVTAQRDKSTEISARISERTSNNIINVVSAKTIEISPDLNVANVIQRVSGVTIERNSTGDGQYAILRGMDKRFNYTLVNGVKIPSPDNKNRFVPLDIFPSELLERLEVTKSLTANMEGDGIGGAVNMIMRDAPGKIQLTANLGTGYNTLFFKNDYQSFDLSAINSKSPNERYGLAYPVQIKDFSIGNMHLETGHALPNLTGGFSLGNRVLKEKLGIILAGSYQKSDRANSSNLYSTSFGPDELQSITHRFFSNQQVRMGLHAKFDWKLSPDNKFTWYNAYMDFRNAQVREAISSNSLTTRLRWNRQTIFNSTLKGSHDLKKSNIILDWSLSYGKAYNETPDNIQINELIINSVTSLDQNDGASRRWEHNSDQDLTGLFNIVKRIKFENEMTLDVSTGGLYRDKVRSSFYNEYHFKPYDESKPNPRELIRGIDYTNFDQIKFSVNNYGNLSDPLNYDATEKIGAWYIMEKLKLKNLEIVSGIRAEYTNQGYNLKFTTEGARNNGNQEYVDILPSIAFKYEIHKNTNLRLSYSMGINRPSFFEIVPYSMIYEEYKERGNPDLKHTTANNFDLRYEYFPHPSDQIMAGIFYKNLKDPIEFGMMNGFGQDIFYMPMNFGNANNYGIELDFIKYFSWFGIKANYTFTNSNITTIKMKIIENPDPNGETNIITEYVNQTRPLFGQAQNVMNFSLLFKDKRSSVTKGNGWDGQLAFAYTGDRLCIVSRYLDEDSWQAAYVSMDASIEKRFKKGLAIFGKASNLLNTPMIQYVRRNETNATILNVERYKGGIVERKEYYGLNILLGLRFHFQ